MLAPSRSGGRLRILSGPDELCLPAQVMGATGAVGSTYNWMAPLFVRLYRAFLPHDPLPRSGYDVVISNSILHQLHDPTVLWRTLWRAAKKGAQGSMLHAVADDWLLPLAHASVVAPSQLPRALAGFGLGAAIFAELLA